MDVLETLAYNLRLRSGNVDALGESPREKINVDGLADFVVEERGAEDEVRPDASGFGLEPDVGHAGHVGGGGGEDGEAFRRRLRDGIGSHGDEFVAGAFAEDVEGVFGGSGADGEGAGGGFAVEGVNDVGDDGLAVVVEGLGRTEFFDEGEILG